MAPRLDRVERTDGQLRQAPTTTGRLDGAERADDRGRGQAERRSTLRSVTGSGTSSSWTCTS